MALRRLAPGDGAWDMLAGHAPDATIFHHPAWLALLRAQYGYGVGLWCIGDGAGAVAAGLPVACVRSRLTGTRLVALPFSDSCRPLAAPGCDGSLDELAEAVAAERGRQGLALEVRADVAWPSAHTGDEYVEHRVALGGDHAAVEACFSAGQARRGVRRAAREGVVVEHAIDRAGLERFYRLHMATRAHQGVPTQPKSFILRFARLFDAGLGFVLLARHDGQDVAAAVFLRAGATLTYKYGASDRTRLGVRPNHAIFAEAIRRGCAEGLTTLDLGRSDLANAGLRRFKASWGAVERPLRYTVLAEEPPEPGGGRLALLEAVIRRGPPSLSRLIGEAAYRHAG